MRPSKTIALSMWVALSGALLWMALGTQWLLAWLAFALMSLLPTLMLMVIAHSPERTAARMMHDRE